MIVGVEQGSYTVNAGTRQITLSGLTFTPTIESILVVLNITQDKMYYAAAQTYTRTLTITPSGANFILEYQNLEIFPVLGANDKLHIQIQAPSENDGEVLYSGSIVATGTGSTLDTLSFGSIVAQFAGTWDGIVKCEVFVFIYFHFI
jgi:hypothetical protein